MAYAGLQHPKRYKHKHVHLSSPPSTHTALALAVHWAQVLGLLPLTAVDFFFLSIKACSEVGLSKMDTRGGSKRVNDGVS